MCKYLCKYLCRCKTDVNSAIKNQIFVIYLLFLVDVD